MYSMDYIIISGHTTLTITYIKYIMIICRVEQITEISEIIVNAYINIMFIHVIVCSQINSS